MVKSAARGLSVLIALGFGIACLGCSSTGHSDNDAGATGTAGAAGTAGATGIGGRGGNVGTAGTGGAGGSAGAARGGASGTTCGGAPGSSGAGGGVDYSWARWPMPNDPAGVAAGAPNLQSYTINDDDTVTDNVTGLMWQRFVPPDPSSGALAYCRSLCVGGHRDWRAPSAIELVSIIDHGVAAPGPAINTAVFPDTPAKSFWTTEVAPVLAPYDQWYVYFSSGLVAPDSTLHANFRCVRAGAEASATRYTVDGGTVHDNNTKLTWQLAVPTTTYDWPNARLYCASAEVSAALGGTGWRLPTVKELLTLVDFSRANPAIDPTFTGTPSVASFWSSTPVAGATSSAWLVTAYVGSVASYFKQSPYNVRCVR